MNNATEMKANEFDGIPADEMTADVRRKAIIAELARLGFDDPEGFLDKDSGWRLTEEEAKGLDDRVYGTLDNGWDDFCDSVNDDYIGDSDCLGDEDGYTASMGTVWERYIDPCKHKDGSCNAFERLGELYDWELSMAYINNMPVQTECDSPFGDSYDRVKEIFNRYKRLFELGVAHDDYCLGWDAMIADCVHGKNDILDELAFCSVLIEPDMWDDNRFIEIWQDSAKDNEHGECFSFDPEPWEGPRNAMWWSRD